MRYENEAIYVRLLELGDAESLLSLRLRNHEFLKPFEPTRPSEYFTLEGQQLDIEQGVRGAEADQSYIFGVFLSEPNELIGRVALTGIARGPFQNVNLGYLMGQAHNGKGYTTAAVRMVVTFAFTELNLHRIQAGVMPRNTASKRVLEKVGFRNEGLAIKYLRINSQWEDHILYALTQED
ncbi:GNAT family N-acetyltransferase [Paenibacillus pini]|uniref:Ribosomal-protein-S5p-alanine acetyltransferase n=1 Tax=Paenibacillus pini JCM 16418 TaxID=1236976 RepID=W7YH52_9BACL|nr:GNAT family protein [Paenibacillus pini]GAF07782.1 ribosomal-protein-S5p-alanine acetyltransferase [Paenibacillus pini JCM 16418]